MKNIITVIIALLVTASTFGQGQSNPGWIEFLANHTVGALWALLVTVAVGALWGARHRIKNLWRETGISEKWTERKRVSNAAKAVARIKQIKQGRKAVLLKNENILALPENYHVDLLEEDQDRRVHSEIYDKIMRSKSITALLLSPRAVDEDRLNRMANIHQQAAKSCVDVTKDGFSMIWFVVYRFSETGGDTLSFSFLLGKGVIDRERPTFAIYDPTGKTPVFHKLDEDEFKEIFGLE